MRVAIELIGGLGLFLFGMSFMGTALQKAAGSKMRGILAALTNNRIIGVLVGCVVTIVVQSSSATTVMTVGFVNAGLMNLSQAIGVIMGANIGTTITAQLVAFNLTDIAPLIVGLGVAFYYGSKKKRVKEIAEIFIGFGILFLGMAYMRSAISPLKESSVFMDALLNFRSTAEFISDNSFVDSGSRQWPFDDRNGIPHTFWRKYWDMRYSNAGQHRCP
jgi:phosphate:Na+ symporter